MRYFPRTKIRALLVRGLRRTRTRRSAYRPVKILQKSRSHCTKPSSVIFPSSHSALFSLAFSLQA